jgi:hypothetical protein
MPNDAIQYERSTFLNHVFRSRNAEKFKQLGRTSVTLDSNGMFVQFRGIQSHIPYGLIDLETIDALSAGKWLSESDIIELKVRRAEEAVDTLGFCTAKIEQLHATARIFNIAEHEQSDVQELLLQRLTHDPYAFATTLIEQGAVIPDILIDHLTMHGTKHEIHQLTVCAEAVGDLLSGTYLQQDILRKTNYLTLGEDAGAYEARARLLNDPRYYGATKIAKKLLQGGALSEDMNEEFFAFVADYKKGVKSGDQHAFLETVENGHVSRILLNADKHVGPYEQQTFARLPRYERSTYESLERALRVYEHYVRSLQLLEAFNPDQCTTGEWVARHENIKDWLHFTLTNVTSRYASVEQAYQAWRQEAKARVGAVDTEQHTEGNRVGEVPAYRALLHELRAVCGQYEQYLHSNILNPSSFNERFDPNIDKRELVFDPALVEKAQAFVPAANIDEELTRTAPPVRIALLHYSENDPSQTLPMHATQGALDAIRIDRGRPLINVVGGAKYTGQESHILFQTVARSVVSVGHDIKANIGVPGTQSGVGLEFGRANAQYRAAHEHLLHRDKAHMFAINPAGNTYVPDNPYLAEADMNAVYMNNAVDSILTPVRVEWNKRGKERRNSKYKTFISHMELLHDAVSQGNERVAIVLNGGLYTVWEVNELIKHEFDLMLVQGTGRFADAAYEFTYSRVACYGFDADMDDVAFGAFVIEKIQRGMLPEAANEFLEKDFGTVANLTEIPDIEQRETYQVYRDAFREFLTHISKGYFSEVTASSVEEVGDQLGAYFSEGNKAWRASRPPQEFI